MSSLGWDLFCCCEFETFALRSLGQHFVNFSTAAALVAAGKAFVAAATTFCHCKIGNRVMLIVFFLSTGSV